MQRIAVLVALAVGLGSSPLAADLRLEMEITLEQTVGGKAKSEKFQTTTYFRKDMMASRQPDGAWRIIRFDKQVVWDVAKEGKSYREVSFAEVRRQQKRQQQQREARRQRQRKQIEALLKNPALPEARKAPLRKLLEPVIYKVSAGEQERVLDYDCTRYTILRNGKPYMRVWACDTLRPGVDFNRVQSLSASAQPGLQQEMARIKGVWVKYVTEQKGSGYSARQTAVATALSTDPVAAKWFELPVGAQRQK